MVALRIHDDSRGCLAAVASMTLGVFPALAVGMVDSILGLLVYAATIAATFLSTRAMERRALVVGADGLTLHLLMRRTFVPFSAVGFMEYVAPKRGLDADQIRLQLVSGKVFVLPVSKQPIDKIRLVIRRVGDGIEASGRAPSRIMLDREGRTVEAWRVALAQQIGASGDYRSSPITLDDLDAVLQNPAASTEQRIGAALAMSSHLDDGIATRIRAAGAVSASSCLRIALDAITEERLDEKLVEEALDEESSEDVPSAARVARTTVR